MLTDCPAQSGASNNEAEIEAMTKVDCNTKEQTTQRIRELRIRMSLPHTASRRSLLVGRSCERFSWLEENFRLLPEGSLSVIGRRSTPHNHANPLMIKRFDDDVPAPTLFSSCARRTELSSHNLLLGFRQSLHPKTLVSAQTGSSEAHLFDTGGSESRHFGLASLWPDQT